MSKMFLFSWERSGIVNSAQFTAVFNTIVASLAIVRVYGMQSFF